MVGSREEMVWDGRLGWVTHYFLLELGPTKVPCETKEISGGGGWVGVGRSGGCKELE